jgi:SAM-dependent methyltransferase
VLSAAAATGLLLLPFDRASAQAVAITPPLDVPYVPTPQEVVDGMLALAKVGKDDYLIDLGCGDGRIVVSAAHQRGARALGIDLNPERIAEANANARKAGVEGAPASASPTCSRPICRRPRLSAYICSLT